jgi:Flp pilus assembly pilin Flp
MNFLSDPQSPICEVHNNFEGVMKRFFTTTKAAALLEYGLLIGLISVLAIGSILAMGERVQDIFNTTKNQIELANSETALPETDPPSDPDPVEPETTGNPVYVSFDEAQMQQTSFHTSTNGNRRWPLIHPTQLNNELLLQGIHDILCRAHLGTGWTATEWTHTAAGSPQWADWTNNGSNYGFTIAGPSNTTGRFSNNYVSSLTCFNPDAPET